MENEATLLHHKMGKEPIHVSVIIPTYNSGTTIAETIDSVRRQTYTGWELIIIDDGSTDETLHIISDLIKEDCRIRVISQTNGGACVSRNKGMQSASFDWLLFLDSDDWIAENYLEEMTKVLQVHTELDGVHCGWTRVTPQGALVEEKYGPEEADLFPILTMYCPFAIHACVIRKSLVQAAGGFDISLKACEDWDLWLKIARIGARFGLVKEVMAFYRMRKHSLSSNAMQFFHDGVRVLSLAHGPDDRLKDLDLLYPSGAASELLPNRKMHFTSWIAGYLIGDGQDARPLLASLEKDVLIEPYWVAYSIFESALIPDCQTWSHWRLNYPRIESGIEAFLRGLEEHCQVTDLARRCQLSLLRMILQKTQIEEAFPLGIYYAACIEVTAPIVDLFIENRALERLYCVVAMEGRLLGHIELPICDGMVTAYVLKDAIAFHFHWTILGRFFANTIYQEKGFQAEHQSLEEIHNRIGWTTFLQQLWDRPNWEASQFYNSDVNEKAFRQVDEAEIRVIEVSQQLPDIKTTKDSYQLVFSVGGVNVGVISIPVKGSVLRSFQIMAAINTESGLELSRVCVREALMGRPLTDPTPLVQRLHDAYLANKDSRLSTGNHSCSVSNNLWITPRSLLLGRRAGQIDSSIARRASLPAAAAATVIEMTKPIHEPVVLQHTQLNDIDHIMYAPEAILMIQEERAGQQETQGKEANVYGRQHFESLFSKQADPWKYTHPYEQTKYELTLSLLPFQKINTALEIACAEGHFTEQLAPLVNHLTAADISTVALQRAAQRCERYGHINYQHLDLVQDSLPDQFELIVCSEVLYYVGNLEKLKAVARKISGALLPNGYLVMAHAHQVIDEPNKPGFDWGLPYGAKVIGETFAKTPSLNLVQEIRTPLYRVQLFRKTKSTLFSRLLTSKPSIQFLDQPTPVPEAVMDSVRWQGGRPSTYSANDSLFTDRLPILMYHRVSPRGSAQLSRYRISPAAFEEQLKYLKDSGYYSVSLHQWAAAMAMKRPLPGLAVLFTFDDGYTDFYEYAWPLLKKYGFTATVFLVAGQVGKRNNWDAVYGEDLKLMRWWEIKELQAQGVEFGSHTATHQLLTSLTPTEVVLEGAQSRTLLQYALQKPVQTIAYPYGDTDSVVTHLMGACGYTIGVGTEVRLSTFYDDLMCLPRIEVEGHFSLEQFITKLS